MEKNKMILDQFKLDGKVALVTGAAQGLGQGYAIALAQAGADVVGLDIGDVTATGEQVTKLGRRFMTVKCNLREASAEDLNKIVADIVAQLGRLDILVNNAGIIRRTPALEYTEKDWDDVLTINLRSVFFMSQAAARHMVKQGGGKIINVASMLSYQGGILVPSYTAAKSAIAGVTRALANEWAKYNINVNAIAPGYMATDNTAPIRADANRNQSILDRIPIGRWGTPEDLQGIVVFLSSRASDYMQGSIVPVDGGWLAR
jgi:2-dehydro-3-deoxy-D-gluconate 5-dehydrogenase